MKHILLLAMGLVGVGVFSGQADQPAAPAAVPSPADLTPPGPVGAKIKFQDETPGGVIYEAGKVLISQPVEHSFYFTNIGDQTLEVTRVNGTCGCTVAGEWTKRVEPGQSGFIPIKVTLNPSWSGMLTKPATVECNDKSKQPGNLSVNMRFTIWKPVEVSRQIVSLNVPADSDNYPSETVKVDNNTDAPVAVYGAESNSKNFAVDIATNKVGKQYELIIRAVPPFTPGQNVSGQISAKTSSTNMAEVKVTAMAMVPQPVVVSPPQISLEAGPLAAESKKVVTISYNGGKSLQLTEPVFSAKGVDVTLSETQPGKLFTATLTFPAGFEGPGRPMEFTVKSSSSHMAVIRVPVVQQAAPSHPVVPVKPAAAGARPVSVKSAAFVPQPPPAQAAH